jgi:hypothetical protein
MSDTEHVRCRVEHPSGDRDDLWRSAPHALERGLLIGADVVADLVRPKTFIERNAYLISIHRFGHPLRRESIEHDAYLAHRALICDAIGLIGLL